MTSQAPHLSAAEVNPEFVLAKCDYFVDVQLWPLLDTLHPRRWLENFPQEEIPHAIHLLNAFLYFSNPLIDEMLRAAFLGLCQHVLPRGAPLLSIQTAWATFVDSTLVTFPTGEIPSSADSGFNFARKARQVLGIPEPGILAPEDALATLLHRGPRPVVFFDDFVGSGRQFIRTWERIYNLSATMSISFARLSSTQRGGRFFYCPLLCTEYGYKAIRSRCPQVVISPAHIVPSRYSAIVPDSIIWPPDLQPTAPDFLRRASTRAGIADTNGGAGDWRGFDKLALAIAIGDSVPDATLPIFYCEKNGWKPLIRRR